MTEPPGLLIFLHPSDEMYGADRMLLEMLKAVADDMRVQVWLPNDLKHPASALCDELARRGVDVRHEALPIMRRAYRTPTGLLGLARRSFQLVRLLRAERPQAVYCTTSAAFLGAPLARIAGVRMVIGHLQEIWSLADRLILGTTARFCHTLLAISEAVRTSTSPRTARRTVVVPNGTPDPGSLQPLAERSGELQFLVASRWNSWKGHGTLLAAWDMADIPGRLVILGGPPLIGEFIDVVGLAAGIAKPESVSVVGEVADVASYIVAADVVVMPSDQPEPFGLIAIEAFAQARPVIGSAGGGLLDIVSDGTDGWLYAPADPTALAAVLRSLTRDSVTTASEHARTTYQRRFTIEQFAQRWRESVIDLWNGPQNSDR